MIFSILYTVIVPIFLLIGLGVLLDRRFRLDLPTLNKLNFYAFVPALVFVKLLEADVSAGQLARIGAFSLLHGALLFTLAWLIFSHRALKAHQTVLALGTLLSNVGNYGIPLVLLAFGDQQIGVITVIVVVQNLLTFTLGIWLFERKGRQARQVLASMLGIPVIYAVAIALALHFSYLRLPAPIMVPLRYLADGLIPIALLTLGAQLSRTRLTHGAPSLATAGALRLLISPVVAAALIPVFGFTPPVSSVLIVASAFPVAVNVYILAAEYRQDEALASQAIFWTTLLSAVTMSMLLLLVRR